MRVIKILILLFIIACGDNDRKGLCYSREEALMACMVDEMRNKNVTKEQAELTCDPYYAYDGCYYLIGKGYKKLFFYKGYFR